MIVNFSKKKNIKDNFLDQYFLAYNQKSGGDRELQQSEEQRRFPLLGALQVCRVSLKFIFLRWPSTSADWKCKLCKSPRRRCITVYIEYQSVCPFVGIGPPHTHSLAQASVSPPLDPKGRKQHFLAGEVVGGHNSDDWKESLALCILCGPRPRF